MGTPRIIFIDSVHPILKDRLDEMGYICDWRVKDSREEILRDLHRYTGMVIRSRFTIDREVLDAASNLKFICRSGSGMENIDMDYAATRGITCINSPEGNRDAVGEHAVGMLLALFNNLQSGDLEVRKGKWDREGNRGYELKGKTIGIIGYGNMGQAFAQRLSGFECTVLAYDKYRDNYSDQWAKETALDQIYTEADVVSIHLPLSDETDNYINREFLERFSKPIYIVNTSRGKQLSIQDLVNALDAGNVIGACLDVLEVESSSFETLDNNPYFQELVKRNNVLLSPHVAGWTHESYVKLSTFLADKVETLFGNN